MCDIICWINHLSFPRPYSSTVEMYHRGFCCCLRSVAEQTNISTRQCFLFLFVRLEVVSAKIPAETEIPEGRWGWEGGAGGRGTQGKPALYLFIFSTFSAVPVRPVLLCQFALFPPEFFLNKCRRLLVNKLQRKK
jgi:hypothetical protein